jgi:DNA topoisomerase-1
MRLALDFSEELHERDDHGRWAVMGASTHVKVIKEGIPAVREKGKMVKGKMKLGKILVPAVKGERIVTRLDSKGKPLPQKIQDRMNELGVQFAWTNVHLNKDPDDNVHAQAKGQVLVQIPGKPDHLKWQSIYTKAYTADRADDKFGRVKDFEKARPALVKQAEKDMKKGDDTAAAICLVNATGFRVGSSTQLGKEEAFGATSLEGRHVRIVGDKVIFHFTGKHAVDIRHTIVDSALAKDISARKAEAGPHGQLYPHTNEPKAINYIKEKTGNEHFKVHDFRTWHGTMTARAIIGNHKPINGKTAFKKYQKEVAIKVGEHLHNGWGMALKSYIDPKVWSSVQGVA